MLRAAWSRQNHRDPVCAGRPERRGPGQTRKQVNCQGLSLPSVAAAAAAHCCSATDAAIIHLCLSDCQAKYLLAFALSGLVLHCLALTPPLSSSTASGRRHAPGPLWLPSALNSARVAAEKVEMGRGPCSVISTAAQALQSGGTQRSKPKVDPEWRCFGDLVAVSSVGNLTQPNKKRIMQW